MTVGVLREPENEKRVVITPEIVEQLKNLKVEDGSQQITEGGSP